MKQGNLNGYLQKNIIHFVQNKKTNIFKSILVRRLASMGGRDLIHPYHILRHSPFPLGPAVQGRVPSRPCSYKRRSATTFEHPPVFAPYSKVPRLWNYRYPIGS